MPTFICPTVGKLLKLGAESYRFGEVLLDVVTVVFPASSLKHQVRMSAGV